MNARVIIVLAVWVALQSGGVAQIRVSPTGVNTNTTGATTVFLTFGGLRDQIPAEAVWCGEIDVQRRPVPGTIFGRLPVRFDLSSGGMNGVFTDIMSIPPSVARRAYQAAVSGATSNFFYVRRFVSTTGGPDEYVAVTCRLATGGARAPFSITGIRLSFAEEQTVLSIKSGDPLPPFSARIAYTGTGQLKGRWEIVRPGDTPPSEEDLLTEATLPIEQRARQRRYLEIERFNIFLPPGGEHLLQGPNPSLLPTELGGLYLILLRLEAADNTEAKSDLSQVGAGTGVIPSGAVAGFPIPPLRYFVGAARATGSANSVRVLLPEDLAEFPVHKPIDFGWLDLPQASFHRLVVIDPQNNIVFTAIVRPGVGMYRAPAWLSDKVGSAMCSWRVEALDEFGEVMAKSEWRTVRFSE